MQYFLVIRDHSCLIYNNDIAFGLKVEVHNQGNHRLLSAQSSPNQIVFKWVKGTLSELPIPKYSPALQPILRPKEQHSLDFSRLCDGKYFCPKQNWPVIWVSYSEQTVANLAFSPVHKSSMYGVRCFNAFACICLTNTKYRNSSAAWWHWLYLVLSTVDRGIWLVLEVTLQFSHRANMLKYQCKMY